MILYEKTKDDLSVRFNIHIPLFYVGKIEDCDMLDNWRRVGTILDTKVYYEKSNKHLFFISMILGFGISIQLYWSSNE